MSKKKAVPQDDFQDLVMQEKLTKSQIEFDLIQRELQNQNEINARLRQVNQEQRARIVYLENQVSLGAQDRIDLSADMTRHFNVFKSDLVSEVNRLEVMNCELQEKLSALQALYEETQRNHATRIAEKETLLEETNLKMNYMNDELENMIKETVNKITKKLENVATRWKDNDMVTISEQNARRLDDFQLTRLALENARRF